MNFTAPIPGQSLTTEPGNVPWEQPPMMEDPEEAIKFHTKRLRNPDVLDDLIFILEAGYPVKPLVMTLNTTSTMKGLYSVDVGLIIAPVLHELIVAIAKKAGISYDEGFSNKKAEADKEKAKLSYLISKRMETLKPEDAGGDFLSGVSPDAAATDAAPVEDAMPTDIVAEAPQTNAPSKGGIMQRRGAV